VAPSFFTTRPTNLYSRGRGLTGGARKSRQRRDSNSATLPMVMTVIRLHDYLRLTPPGQGSGTRGQTSLPESAPPSPPPLSGPKPMLPPRPGPGPDGIAPIQPIYGIKNRLQMAFFFIYAFLAYILPCNECEHGSMFAFLREEKKHPNYRCVCTGFQVMPGNRHDQFFLTQPLQSLRIHPTVPQSLRPDIGLYPNYHIPVLGKFGYAPPWA
jgi:hypothetical protein